MNIDDKLLGDTMRALRAWRVWLYLGRRDLSARFRRTFLGPLWIWVNLMIFVAGVGVVYGVLFGQRMNEHLPYLTAGFAIWGFLLSSLTDSGMAFVNAEGYIKQFPYPKQIYLLRSLVTYVIVLFVGLSALIPIQIFFDKLQWQGWLIAIPGLLLLICAGLAHTTICAYVGVRYRDIPHMLGGGLQVLFFVTPIIYPVSVLKGKGVDFVYQLNPLYHLIDVVRFPLTEGTWASGESYILSGMYLLAVWIIGIVVARQMDSRVVFLL